MNVHGHPKNTMANEWRSFARAILDPIAAGDVQRQEMRRSFYAGAWSLMCILERIGDDDISEDVGTSWIESIKREIKDFQSRIGVNA